MSLQKTPCKILSSNWKHERKMTKASVQPERCSVQKHAQKICLDSRGWKEEAVGLLKYLVLLSIQNKLLTLMTALSEMVYFKATELRQKEQSQEWQHATKQGKPGWIFDLLQRDSFHAHALALDFTWSLVNPGDGEERAGSRRHNICICAAAREVPCGMVRSRFSLPVQQCVIDLPVWVSA